MRYDSKFRNGLFATGLIALLAAAPSGQIFAQDAGGAMPNSSSNQTVPDKVSDAWITTKVKSEMAATKGIKSTDISVSTSDGVVTLTGSVATAKVKAKAEHVAKRVKGVKSVESSGLSVGSAS
jgi:hyperosmotically inducible periplasmic protein